MPRRILQNVARGALHPAGVVRVRLRLALLAEARVGIPHTVKQYEHHADAVLVGDAEELIDAREESLCVLLPENVVQEHANAVEPQPLGQREFPVDGVQVERFRLPHLELVDRVRRDVVAPDEPRLLAVPVVGFLLGPAPRRLGAGYETATEGETRDEEQAMNERHGRGMVAESRPGSSGCAAASPQVARATFSLHGTRHYPSRRALPEGGAVRSRRDAGGGAHPARDAEHEDRVVARADRLVFRTRVLLRVLRRAALRRPRLPLRRAVVVHETRAASP